ncbi:hypothetical protein BD626DRAFT_475766, partial [Schizophyllum amplum]
MLGRTSGCMQRRTGRRSALAQLYGALGKRHTLAFAPLRHPARTYAYQLRLAPLAATCARRCAEAPSPC